MKKLIYGLAFVLPLFFLCAPSCNERTEPTFPAGGVKIVGVVLEEANGKPTNDAVLSLCQADNAQTSKLMANTGTDGIYISDQLKPGTYRLTAVKGDTSVCYIVKAESAGEYKVEVMLPISLDKGMNLEVVITKSGARALGNVKASVTVVKGRLISSEKTADAVNGRASIRNFITDLFLDKFQLNKVYVTTEDNLKGYSEFKSVGLPPNVLIIDSVEVK